MRWGAGAHSPAKVVGQRANEIVCPLQRNKLRQPGRYGLAHELAKFSRRLLADGGTSPPGGLRRLGNRPYHEGTGCRGRHRDLDDQPAVLDHPNVGHHHDHHRTSFTICAPRLVGHPSPAAPAGRIRGGAADAPRADRSGLRDPRCASATHRGRIRVDHPAGADRRAAALNLDPGMPGDRGGAVVRHRFPLGV